MNQHLFLRILFTRWKIWNDPLKLIEIQSGTYLGEDDIIRLEQRSGFSKSGLMNVVNNSRDVIYSSGIVFGTSGARGLVKDFTPQVCAALRFHLLPLCRNIFL